jgi:hypothetical protein
MKEQLSSILIFTWVTLFTALKVTAFPNISWYVVAAPLIGVLGILGCLLILLLVLKVVGK